MKNIVIKAKIGEVDDCDNCILWGRCNIRKCFGAFEEIEDAMPMSRTMSGDFAYFTDGEIE